ncbi:MAG: alkaline phosphatase family protein, partial [Candidatus Binataceae bacterium]
PKGVRVNSSLKFPAATLAFFAMTLAARGCALADGNLANLNHVIIVMQENHSFDNYFGALPYDPQSPYHPASAGPCSSSDNKCVDGLTCTNGSSGLVCTNFNRELHRGRENAFHNPRYCTGPDLAHGWRQAHQELNSSMPNAALRHSRNNGFVIVNQKDEQDLSGESPGDDTMGFYDQDELPFYYGLAETFALDDRYFCEVPGPTMPNRSYLMAGTSFGHVTTSEMIPPAGGYKPITGTIFDLLDQAGVSWLSYAADTPYSSMFRGSDQSHVRSMSNFFADAAAGTLPALALVDSSMSPDQQIGSGIFETDEHPPSDIRAGEYFVWQIVSAMRASPQWKDSIVFITYDEHGGFYDHVAPPAAAQNGALNPDGISPGMCADLSNPPASQTPGSGAECSASQAEVKSLCRGFKADAKYPRACANFNQLGVRVPFLAVSPFAKPQYVSHTVADHASMLALVEKRFLQGAHLTARDANASTLEDMFDFDNSPSLGASIPDAPPLPLVNDPGCPP